MTEPTNWRAVIEKLTPKQREVLGFIYINEDGGHSPRTVAVLVKKGLVDVEERTLQTHLGPLKVARYVPSCFAAHRAWCEWCSDNLTDEEKRQIED